MYNPRYPQTQVSAVSAPALLGQVLGITGVGFLITALGSYLFRGLSIQASWIALLVGLAMIFAINATRRNPAVALLWFYAFTFVEGVAIAPIITYYANLAGNDVVVSAAGTTGLGMFALAAISYAFSFDWRRFSGVAFGALILLVVAGVASMFFHFLQPSVYSWLVLAVFTLFTLIDFSRIRSGGGGATAVDLALSIYLDALNIFLALLQLFGMRRRDD
jgi:modulator of FtsH protease